MLHTMLVWPSACRRLVWDYLVNKGQSLLYFFRLCAVTRRVDGRKSNTSSKITTKAKVCNEWEIGQCTIPKMKKKAALQWVSILQFYA